MSMPISLKKTSQNIAQELSSARVKINFKITNYNPQTKHVEYALTSTQLPFRSP